MTIRQVINLLKKHKPKNVAEARFIGLKLRQVGQGAFRAVYAIKDLPLVVKFPSPYWTGQRMASCVDHARFEIRTLKRLSTTKMKRYLPKIYFTDWKTGVVCMKKVKPLNSSGARSKARQDIEKFFQLDKNVHDFAWQNLAKNGKRTVIIDLGMI